jgi:hypothetical protein
MPSSSSRARSYSAPGGNSVSPSGDGQRSKRRFLDHSRSPGTKFLSGKAYKDGVAAFHSICAPLPLNGNEYDAQIMYGNNNMFGNNLDAGIQYGQGQNGGNNMNMNQNAYQNFGQNMMNPQLLGQAPGSQNINNGTNRNANASNGNGAANPSPANQGGGGGFNGNISAGNSTFPNSLGGNNNTAALKTVSWKEKYYGNEFIAWNISKATFDALDGPLQAKKFEDAKEIFMQKMPDELAQQAKIAQTVRLIPAEYLAYVKAKWAPQRKTYKVMFRFQNLKYSLKLGGFCDACFEDRKPADTSKPYVHVPSELITRWVQFRAQQ